MFVYHYKKLIHFIIVLGVLSYSHFGYANVTVESVDDSTKASAQPDHANEIAANTQVQDVKTDTDIKVNDAFQVPDYRFEFTGSFGLTKISNETEVGLLMNVFTGDILYRIIQYDRLNSSLGLRVRTNLRGDHKEIDVVEFHELTFLIQNLVFTKIFSTKVFVGPTLGLHILKYFRAVSKPQEGGEQQEDRSFGGFWDSFSYQVGIKYGVILSSHFAITMEVGFDQLRFSKYERIVEGLGTDNRNNRETDTVNEKLRLHNTYFTFGISYFL